LAEQAVCQPDSCDGEHFAAKHKMPQVEAKADTLCISFACFISSAKVRKKNQHLQHKFHIYLAKENNIPLMVSKRIVLRLQTYSVMIAIV
jgi:hypothetical protein